MAWFENIDAAIRESEQQTRDALNAAMNLNAERQAAAGAFIRDHGHDTVHGHPRIEMGQDHRGNDARPTSSVEQN